MNVYLWKRLVKDTTGPGPTRRILNRRAHGLAASLVTTSFVPRFADVTAAGDAWPGYLVVRLIVMVPTLPSWSR